MVRQRWVGAPVLLLCALMMGSVSPATEQEPEYPHGEFEDDCTLCHGPEGWKPAVIGPEFDHEKWGFPLRVSHAITDCRGCHQTLDFGRADPACVACHLDVHEAELGTDCARCHTSRSFIDRGEMVRMHLSTRFPLNGTHRVVDCEDCHRPASPGLLQFVNTPTDCESCHLADYQATTSPDHQASGFDLRCEACHSVRTWSPAGFNHNTLAAGARCDECHLDDFMATSDPDHQAGGFPRECELCHSTRFWVPSVFDGLNHDALFFPIFSGKHKNKWDTCNDCHLVPNDFPDFSCIDCHKHDDPVEAAGQHEGVSGYQYDSQACYVCHPTGRKE